MNHTVRRAIRFTTRAVALGHLALRGERDALVALTFHSLLPDATAGADDVMDTAYSVTVGELRAVIEYYRAKQYEFVSPEDVVNGLAPNRKYALITFDDGYRNNLHALPVLEEHGVPAVFFVSTAHVVEQKAFWWDVLYRACKEAGVVQADYRQRLRDLIGQPTETVEATLAAGLGDDAFDPIADLDRPMTADELRDFGRHRLVTIGNHTSNHAILTAYPDGDMRRRITDAQAALEDMTGNAPTVISYPCGKYNGEILRVAREAGLTVGFSTRETKNAVPLDLGSDEALTLGRFGLARGRGVMDQAVKFRCELFPQIKRIDRKLASM